MVSPSFWEIKYVLSQYIEKEMIFWIRNHNHKYNRNLIHHLVCNNGCKQKVILMILSFSIQIVKITVKNKVNFVLILHWQSTAIWINWNLIKSLHKISGYVNHLTVSYTLVIHKYHHCKMGTVFVISKTIKIGDFKNERKIMLLLSAL